VVSLLMIFGVSAALAPEGTASASSVNVPSSPNQCKSGGWSSFTDQHGAPFSNQGQCVTWALHHPISLADVASSSPFTGTTSYLPFVCSSAEQRFDATYPGNPTVGTVTLHIDGCSSTSFFDLGTFTMTTDVGSIGGMASGPVDLTVIGGSV